MTIALAIALIALLVVYCWRMGSTPKPRTCPRCGAPTEWVEGMGAGFERCPHCWPEHSI